MLIYGFTFIQVAGCFCGDFLGDLSEARIDRYQFLCLQVFFWVARFDVGTLLSAR
jgi:hypothetical protein